MKKLVIMLVVLLTTFCLFADDALVLPAGVIRLTLADISAFGDQAFDVDGEAQDSTEFMFNKFGTAIEFGVTDKLTAAVQWTPSFNITGSIKDDNIEAAGKDDQLVYNGLADLFVGAKYQVVGSDAVVPSEKIRFAAALGLKIPLDYYNTEDEFTAAGSGDDFRTMSGSDTGSLGIGGRLSLDFIVIEDFYINVYSEIIYYLEKKDTYVYDSFAKAYPIALAAGDPSTKGDLGYGTWMKFELEPHYTIQLDGGSNIGLGLPAKLSLTPEYTIDGTAIEDSNTMAYSIAPAVSYFNAKGFPFEVKAQYDLPLGGVNTNKTSLFIFQLKLFYDFY